LSKLINPAGFFKSYSALHASLPPAQRQAARLGMTGKRNVPVPAHESDAKKARLARAGLSARCVQKA
jgi:hypothetical protein